MSKRKKESRKERKKRIKKQHEEKARQDALHMKRHNMSSSLDRVLVMLKRLEVTKMSDLTQFMFSTMLVEKFLGAQAKDR